MENPVMTSATSHRLRSAVSACAQPTHSYLSTPYLGSIQCESQDSGGCLKKFNGSGKNGSLLEKLSITKKPQTSNSDFSVFYKRHKPSNKNALNYFFGSKNQLKSKNCTSSANDILKVIPKQFALGNCFLPKLKRKESLSDLKTPRVRLYEAKESGKVVFDEGSTSVNTNSSNNFLNNNNNKGATCNHKILNCRIDDCKKSNLKNNRKRINTSLCGKKDGIKEEIELSDECSECCGVNLEENQRRERREISKWQPRHVLTRRMAQIVREIQNVWRARVGCSKTVKMENVQLLFHDLQLYPTASQVSKMLGCARDCSENSSTNFVTFGDFYTIASNLFKFSKDFRIPRTLQQPSAEKNVDKGSRKFSKGMSKYEVFLGGSCNPTTWRTDVAIPELENMGISYYNPVEDWRPELLEVEYHAKENATVMFFVIDNQTRGVSALIEVAHLAGNQRKLILVIQSYAQKNQIICDEEISQMEYEDLKSGQEVLQLLVERQGIPVFDNIKVALQRTEKILRENLSVQDLQSPAVADEKLLDLRELFDKLDPLNSGEITFEDLCLACKILCGRKLSAADWEYVLTKSGKELNGTLPGNVKFDFKHFLDLMTEFQIRQQKGTFPTSPPPTPGFLNACKDVYLGGTTENTTWRESVAIPALKSQNLTYFVPKTTGRKERFTDVEAAAMDHSFVLLFVITDTARSIAAMAIAGHYIGRGAKVALCVQHLPEGATIANERLSESAVKDYNRARMYLMDIAKRNGVPVFKEISNVVQYVIRECKQR